MLKEARIEHYKGVFLRPEHIDRLAGLFALGERPEALEALEGGQDNLNLALRDARGRGIAVARHYLVTPSDKVAAELEFVRFLSGHGFPTPEPIRTRGGELFVNNGAEPSIALFPFVEGRQDKQWTPGQLRVGGRELARMHRLCTEARYRIGRDKDHRRILEEGLDAVAATDLPDKAVFIDEVERFLFQDLAEGRATLDSLSFGPIHHDFNPGNVFWAPEGGFKALIDFDEAHDAPLAMDLVMAFHYLALDDDYLLRLSACRDLVAGYEELRQLSDVERGSLQFCWDLSNITGAMEFIIGNADWLENVMECRSFSLLYLKNRGRLRDLS